MAPVALIIGGSRGIGLALAAQAVKKGYQAYATCRSPTEGLSNLEGVSVLPNVDVTDPKCYEMLLTQLPSCIDVVIHNSGIARWDSNFKMVGSLDESDLASFSEEFTVNSIAPLRSLNALVKSNKLHKSKFVCVTSRMGSIGDGSGKYYGYRGSKAWLNMSMAMAAKDLEGIVDIAIVHPGMVSTDMTASLGGGIPPEEAAAGIFNRVDELNSGNSGTFWHAITGEILPW